MKAPKEESNMKGMTDQETAVELRRYVESPDMGRPFSWCTDACGYDQHMRFVKHRNNNWNGGDWKQFILDYAEGLA